MQHIQGSSSGHHARYIETELSLHAAENQFIRITTIEYVLTSSRIKNRSLNK